MTDMKRTYINLLIFKILASTPGRASVNQIHKAIEPNMGISIRSVQRYLNELANWGLVDKDGRTPQGFMLAKSTRELFKDLAGIKPNINFNGKPPEIGQVMYGFTGDKGFMRGEHE